MATSDLRKSILQYAMQGKLVKQDPNDEPASVLLEKIKQEKEKLIKEGKIKKDKNESIIYKGDDNHYYEKINKDNPKDISDEVSCDLPKNWCWIRHKVLFDFVGGSQPPKEKFIFSPKSNYVRLYQIRDYGDKPDPTYIPSEFATKISKKGEILLARYGGSLGKVFFAENGAYNVALAKIVILDNSSILSKYAYYFYCSSLYQTFIAHVSTRSAQGGFNSDEIGELLFPLPPLAEQQRIVNKLEELEPYISEYERLVEENEQLDKEFPEKLKQSILQYAMQGKLVKQNPNDEPASVLLEKIKQEKEKLIKEGKIKRDKNESFIYKGDDKNYYEKIGNKVTDITDEIPFEIPESWILVRQYVVCWLDNGVQKSNKVLPYLEAKTIRGLQEAKLISYGIILEKGQKVILVDGENSGEVMDVPFEGYMGSTFKILGKTSFINYDYLSYFFLQNKDLYKNNKKGAAIPHLNKDIFRNLLFPLPPLAEQQRIVEKIELLFSLL